MKNLKLVLSIVYVLVSASCTPSHFDNGNGSRRPAPGVNSTKPPVTVPTQTQTQPQPQQNPPTSGPTNGFPIPQQNTATDCYKASAFICKVEHLITNKTNAYRATRGKSALTYDSKMAFVARDWSSKQGQSGNISHSGFPNARDTVYAQEFKVSRDFYAENVAMSGGEDSSQTDAAAESIAEDFATMWWNSPGHRANMLGDYSNIGMGMAQASDGSWYGTQIFE